MFLVIKTIISSFLVVAASILNLVMHIVMYSADMVLELASDDFRLQDIC
jgi:hypothetical protein